MRILFIFLDGIGLGNDDPELNPLARAEMPFLGSLLDGRKLTASAAPFFTDQAALLALDANLGVTGLPQSATGQAVLLTGINIPKELGFHYGPKPNQQVAAYLNNGDTLLCLTLTHPATSAASKVESGFTRPFPWRTPAPGIHYSRRQTTSVDGHSQPTLPVWAGAPCWESQTPPHLHRKLPV
jgi:hypothetical protein